MRFVCTLLACIGALMLVAQTFSRDPFTPSLVALDVCVAYIFIYTGSMWIPNPGAPV